MKEFKTPLWIWFAAIPWGLSVCIMGGVIVAVSAMQYGWEPIHTWLAVGMLVFGYLVGVVCMQDEAHMAFLDQQEKRQKKMQRVEVPTKN